MSLHRVARDALYYLLVRVKHNVDDEVNAEDPSGFLDILPYGIAVKPSGAGVVTDHHAVIALYRLAGGDSRHYRLGSAAVAGEIVKFNISHAYDEVGFGNRPCDIDRGSGLRHAQSHAVVRVGIDAFHSVVNRVSDQLSLLLHGMTPVASESKDNGYLAVLHPACLKLVNHRRKDLIARHGAGDVACDDHNPVLPRRSLRQPCRGNRCGKGTPYLVGSGKTDRNVVRQQLGYDVLFVKIYPYRTFSVFQFFYHGSFRSPS